MTPEVEHFLREKVRSLLRLEVLLYFHRNPFTMDYAEGTAMRLGRPPGLVAEALERLAGAGVLHKRVSQFAPTRSAVYSYTRDAAVREVMAQLERLMNDAAGREEILRLLETLGEKV
jgi:hypothetical protein